MELARLDDETQIEGERDRSAASAMIDPGLLDPVLDDSIDTWLPRGPRAWTAL